MKNKQRRQTHESVRCKPIDLRQGRHKSRVNTFAHIVMASFSRSIRPHKKPKALEYIFVDLRGMFGRCLLCHRRS